jgi:hypothetical protein
LSNKTRRRGKSFSTRLCNRNDEVAKLNKASQLGLNFSTFFPAAGGELKRGVVRYARMIMRHAQHPYLSLPPSETMSQCANSHDCHS